MRREFNRQQEAKRAARFARLEFEEQQRQRKEEKKRLMQVAAMMRRNEGKQRAYEPVALVNTPV